ncbi:MAG TPA: serine hydrolase [Xanthomonadales bacterium]|nr:serine hydrolase [Xanthomonadales bacterium]
MNKAFLGILCLLLFPASVLNAASDDGSFPLLASSADKKLQVQLENVVRKQGLWRAVEKGELAVLLAIVTDPERPRLAELNGHKMMYAASLPKIAILLGVAVAIESGRLELNNELHEEIVNMIRYSCNDCATRVLNLVGREELIQLLQSPEYDFYDPNGEGGLWVGKDYGPYPAYHRDPLNNLSHGATAFQVARFYYRLDTGTLVSPEYTELMREALSNPGLKHKFVKGLQGVKGVEVLRKSGTWKNFHADSALVHVQDQTYIMVGLAKNQNGGKWLTQLARPLNDLVRSQKPLKTVVLN